MTWRYAAYTIGTPLAVCVGGVFRAPIVGQVRQRPRQPWLQGWARHGTRGASICDVVSLWHADDDRAYTLVDRLDNRNAS
jgi:hypothetical protein